MAKSVKGEYAWASVRFQFFLSKIYIYMRNIKPRYQILTAEDSKNLIN